jgi:uncharacterized protein (DUF1778 family)
MRSPLPESPTQTRINCRVSVAIKRRAEEAAGILGQSITAFTETALSEKAEEVFTRLGVVRLSDRDFEEFLRIINKPAQVTDALRKAATGYKRLRKADPGSNW